MYDYAIKIIYHMLLLLLLFCYQLITIIIIISALWCYSILFYNLSHTSNPTIKQIEGTLDLKCANKVSALCMLNKSCSYCIPSVQWYHVLCTLSIHLIWWATEVTGNNQIVAVPSITHYSNQLRQFWILMNDTWHVTSNCYWPTIMCRW